MQDRHMNGDRTATLTGAHISRQSPTTLGEQGETQDASYQEAIDFSTSVAESLPQLFAAATLGATEPGDGAGRVDRGGLTVRNGTAERAETCDLMQRLASGGLLATVIERCLKLVAKDPVTRTHYAEDLHRHFRELCPPGVSSIEVEAAERVMIAKAKVLACDLITLDPSRWDAPDEMFFKIQNRASKELDRAMKLYLALRKTATSQPGFRVTVEQTEQDGSRSRSRSVSVEQFPDANYDAA